jgi:DNA-binding TFAR19-related protein (PDSD5 family)
LAEIRARLANLELGARRYAERVYDALVELAEQGRRDRQMEGAASKVA